MVDSLESDIEGDIQGVFHDGTHDQCKRTKSGLVVTASYPEEGSINACTFWEVFDEDGEIENPPFSPLLTEQRTDNKLKELETYLKVIKNYNPSYNSQCMCPCYRQIICYFSGHGGCDRNGSVFMFTDPAVGEKILISDIAANLCQGSSFVRKEKVVCILLFELHLRTEADIEGTPVLPDISKYGNIVIACSGLQTKQNGDEKKEGEEEEEEEVSEWTARLVTDFKCCLTGNYSLIDILENIKNDFPSSLYVSSCGHVILNDCNVYQFYTEIGSSLDTSTNQGVLIVAKSPSQMFEIDIDTVATTFNNLDFKVLYAEDSYSGLIGLIKSIVIRKFNDHFRFLSFYYSGYSGRDSDGRIYILLRDNHKIYLDWIVSLFKQRREIKPCFILFDLCLLPDDDDCSSICDLPLHTTNNCLVAISGLNKVEVSRTTSDQSGEGKWTRQLCQNIAQFDEPLINVLDTTGAQLHELGAQYVNTAVLFYLKKPTRIADSVEKLMEILTTSQSNTQVPDKRVAKKPKNIFTKQPRPDDTLQLLSDFASNWKLIGNNLGLPEGKLQNIVALNKPPLDSLRLMINRAIANNKNWAELCAAVGSISPAKQSEIEKRLEEDPTIYCNYTDE